MLMIASLKNNVIDHLEYQLMLLLMKQSFILIYKHQYRHQLNSYLIQNRCFFQFKKFSDLFDSFQSKKFTETGKFSETDGFLKTGMLSQSTTFSKSDNFSKSSDFTYSMKFSTISKIHLCFLIQKASLKLTYSQNHDFFHNHSCSQDLLNYSELKVFHIQKNLQNQAFSKNQKTSLNTKISANLMTLLNPMNFSNFSNSKDFIES